MKSENKKETFVHTNAFFQMGNSQRGRVFWPEVDFFKSGISQTKIVGGDKLSVQKIYLKFIENRAGSGANPLFICSCAPVVHNSCLHIFTKAFSPSEIQCIPAIFDSKEEEYQFIQILSIRECWRNYPFVGIEPDPYPGFTRLAIFEPAVEGQDIFRIGGYQPMVVVSRRAKIAILESGIKSVEFEPLLSIENDSCLSRA